MLYVVVILISHQYTGSLIACELMDIYQSDFEYSEINIKERVMVGVKVFEAMCFTEQEVDKYKNCYHYAINSDNFKRDRKTTIALINGLDQEEEYGPQTIFNEMLILGGDLASYAVKNKYGYDFIIRMISFHRHMMAQYMGASDEWLPKFGAPCGNLFLGTQLMYQFPESNRMVRNNVNWQASRNLINIDSINDALERKGLDSSLIWKLESYFETEHKKYPLSTILIPQKNCIFEHNEVTLTWLCLDEMTDVEDSVLVLHGRALCDAKASSISVINIIVGYIDNLQELSEQEELTDKDIEESVKQIAKIAFAESHMTDILRGGGSFVEMLVDGLLLAIGLPRYSTQSDRKSLWGTAMCYSGSDEYVEQWSPRLLGYEKLINL